MGRRGELLQVPPLSTLAGSNGANLLKVCGMNITLKSATGIVAPSVILAIAVRR